MKTFKQYLGPGATKQQDAAEIARQKKHLDDKAKEYYDQGAREGGHNAAIAKGITMDLAKKNIKESNKFNPFTRVDLDKIAKSKKREEKEKGLLRKPGSSMKKNTMNYIDKVDKLSENDESMDEACWPGYKRKKGTKEFTQGSCVKEDGAIGGVPTNNVGGGNIAGSGGAGGEPGVSKKRNPVMSFLKRKQTKM